MIELWLSSNINLNFLDMFLSFFIGTKNTDETTIDGGPVVEVTTTNPNKLKVKKPGFKGGNLKVK